MPKELELQCAINEEDSLTIAETPQVGEGYAHLTVRSVYGTADVFLDVAARRRLIAWLTENTPEGQE